MLHEQQGIHAGHIAAYVANIAFKVHLKQSSLGPQNFRVRNGRAFPSLA